MPETTVICAVPVKNEAWILKDFIESAQAWADIIIIIDHDSSDNGMQIARQYDKVRWVPMHDPSVDRGHRRKALIEEARKIPGRRLIFTIDADEMLSANWKQSSEWGLLLNAPEGTRFDFDWIELFPGLEKYAGFFQSGAFVDDDSEYFNRGTETHESRLPLTKGQLVKLNDIKLLHCINVDMERMFSKHRWYKCMEYIETNRRPWSLCIMYQDIRIKTYDAPVLPVDPKWLDGYDWIEKYRSIGTDHGRCYWYDAEVLNYFDKYGTKKFSKLNIWDIDWNQKAQGMDRKGNYQDPRSRYEKMIHSFIETHREDLKIKHTIPMRMIRLLGKTVLRILGW